MPLRNLMVCVHFVHAIFSLSLDNDIEFGRKYSSIYIKYSIKMRKICATFV